MSPQRRCVSPLSWVHEIGHAEREVEYQLVLERIRQEQAQTYGNC